LASGDTGINQSSLSELPHVAVVILNYNGRDYLERFLPSVKASLYPNLEVIVADNASTDGSVAFLKSTHPDVRLLHNPTNEGFAKGYNSALGRVDAEICILLNSDVEVEPDWIGPVVELFRNDPMIAACQPKILDWNRRDRFEYAGAAGGFIDRYGYPFCRGRIFDVCEKDEGQYDDSRQVFWATGAAMFVRTKVFRDLGGFDPFFFAHQEEIDLCWRMQHTGYQVWVCPKSVVYHVGGGTLPQSSPRKTFLNFRNNLVMLWKNLGDGERLWKIPFRFALDALSAWKNLFSGQPGYFAAVVKAHAGFLAWLLLRRWESPFPARKRQSMQGLYKGNVIWMHFVKGKDRFSEIIGVKG
jgi:GT2 family glycosyltransferase